MHAVRACVRACLTKASSGMKWRLAPKPTGAHARTHVCVHRPATWADESRPSRALSTLGGTGPEQVVQYSMDS